MNDEAAFLQATLKTSRRRKMVYPKGVSQITEADVRIAGKEAGLVDTQVVRFSATHTALKLVIPLALRKIVKK